MTRRFRPTHAFVDESIRGQRYLLGCVLIEARVLPSTRAAVSALPTRGRRLHFNNEVDAQRRMLLGAIAELPVRVVVAICHRRHGVTEFVAREACLEAVVREVQALGVVHLVLESRQDDRDDARLITRVRQIRCSSSSTAPPGTNRCSASPTASPGRPVREPGGSQPSSRWCTA